MNEIQRNNPGRQQNASQQPTARQEQPKKKAKRFPIKSIIAVIIIIVITVLAIGAWKYLGPDDGVKKNQYQAVFLQNGQVYFGKLRNTEDTYLTLTDVFYLQVQPSEENEDNPNQQLEGGEPQLIKLGEELHGPEDEMKILQDQVAFWENLTDDSKVVEAIKEFKDKE